jgi:hypothetical protein
MYGRLASADRYAESARRGNPRGERQVRLRPAVRSRPGAWSAPRSAAPRFGTMTAARFTSLPHDRTAPPLPQAPLCEGATGSRLQVAFKRQSPTFVGELDRDIDVPWSSVRGVRAQAGVVRGNAVEEATGHSGVVARVVALAAKDVDATFRTRHGPPGPASLKPCGDRLKIVSGMDRD